MDPQLPIVIVGAGCAGLSVAVHLLDEPGFRGKLVIVEPRLESQYTNDRTWCMFETTRHRFGHLATHRWNQFGFADHAKVCVRRSPSTPYVCIPAARFYDECMTRLRADPRAVLRFGRSVVAVVDGHRAPLVTAVDRTTGLREEFAAAHVFDSRPLPPQEFAGQASDVLLWQQFAGFEIESPADLPFDPDTAVLMDFRIPNRGEIRFIYVLPFGRRSALVELTSFVRKPSGQACVVEDLDRYLRERVGAGGWTVRRVEGGLIPMTTATLPTRISPHVTRIGLAGGAAKPSNGYAFAAIQQHSRQIARSLVHGRLNDRVPGRALSLILDRIFIAYLAKHPERAPSLFLRIASRVNPDRFARFLTNQGGILDDLAVIASMPKWPFIREAFVSYRCWLKLGTARTRALATPHVSTADLPAGVSP